jgi:membrane protein
VTGDAGAPGVRARADALAGRLGALVARVKALPGVETAYRAFVRYNEAGGGVLARGLAFAILFALMPAILLVSSLAAILLGDPSIREAILAALARQFPPLAPILSASVSSAVAVAPTTSILSLVILLWSASGMVRALDVAIGLVFREQAIPRSPLRTVGLVLSIGGGLLVVTVLAVLATFSGPVGELVGIGISTRFAALGGLFAVVLSAYHFLPRARPAWRVSAVPAVAASLGLGVLSAGFGVLSPVLVGSVQVFGALAVVFLGIVWLGFSTDVFLFGAAWTAVRAEDAAAARGPGGN